ncbi:helix-turn-helix domain protein [Actinobacteria bacterium OK074]|nr:helix-turn-helix domain protein [Actinobacteria bacterium OK074]
MAALFGSRVRKFRTAAGWTQTELGRKANVVGSRIAQLEGCTGAKPTLPLTRVLDRVLGADELLVDMWPFVYREAFPDWSQKFIECQQRALTIRQYAASVVPGLLQTADYAHALLSLDSSLSGEEQLNERLALRLQRQGRLRSPNPPRLWIVLDETVLVRQIGSPSIMREQLARLLKAAEEPHITVQVIPLSSGGHEAMGGSLTLLTNLDGTEVAYTEGAFSGQLIEEPEEVERFKLTYDHLRAAALPPLMSVDMIRSAMEGTYRGANVPTRTERRRLAQKQLQQSGGRKLRGGSGRGQRRRLA